jgi:hypothetical protein
MTRGWMGDTSGGPHGPDDGPDEEITMTNDPTFNRLQSLTEQREIFLRYAQMKLQRYDWHGLWDAAIELNRLELEIELEKRK